MARSCRNPRGAARKPMTTQGVPVWGSTSLEDPGEGSPIGDRTAFEPVGQEDLTSRRKPFPLGHPRFVLRRASVIRGKLQAVKFHGAI